MTTPTLQRILDAVRRYWGYDSLRPIFDDLGGAIPYDTIRLVARHLEAVGADHLMKESTPPRRQHAATPG